MIECIVYLNIPHPDLSDISIAEYSFDIGLQPKDIVYIDNLNFDKITESEKYLKSEKGINIPRFEAMVIKREYIIKYEESNSLFEIRIHLEMADKDELPKLVEVINHNYSQNN